MPSSLFCVTINQSINQINQTPFLHHPCTENPSLSLHLPPRPFGSHKNGLRNMTSAKYLLFERQLGKRRQEEKRDEMR